MNKFVGKEALEEVVNKINDIETRVLKAGNNNASDAYTKAESDNKYLIKGNYATLADVQYFVKVINLDDYTDGQPIPSEKPFEVQFDYLRTGKPLSSQHHRMYWHPVGEEDELTGLIQCRFDCFMHLPTSWGSEFKWQTESNVYTILIADNLLESIEMPEYKFVGWLAIGFLSFGGPVLYSPKGEQVTTVFGMTASEWHKIIKERFSESVGRLDKLTTDNKYTVVDSINEVNQKATQIGIEIGGLDSRVTELEEHGGGGYEPPVGGIPKTDLSSDVQQSLNKADSALLSHQDISGLATKEELAECVESVEEDASMASLFASQSATSARLAQTALSTLQEIVGSPDPQSALALEVGKMKDNVPLPSSTKGFFVTDDFRNIMLKCDEQGLDAALVTEHFKNVVNDYNVIDGSEYVVLEETFLENVKQEYIGGYIGINLDHYTANITPSLESDYEPWNFFSSLDNGSLKELKEKFVPGNGYGIKYIRVSFGLSIRGKRVVDEASGLVKNWGERFKGQLARVRFFLDEISKNGGGIAPEYWCPPPYWTTAQYGGVNNFLWAGGDYPRTTTLASIKTSDPTQYNKLIEDFTDSIIDDLEWAHLNIAPVRMFGLQNEPRYSSLYYGTCGYDKTTYNDVLEVLYPKIMSSQILSEFNGIPNEVKIHVASDDTSGNIFDTGIPSTFVKNHSDIIWGYTHHNIRKVNGEQGVGGDWYKSEEFKSLKGQRKNVILNEYEYFTNSTDYAKRCANNMLHNVNEIIYGEALTTMPIITIFKQIGQTAASSNTQGYALIAVNPAKPYDFAIDNNNKLGAGLYSVVSQNYNSYCFFFDNARASSYVCGYSNKNVDNFNWVALRFGNKTTFFIANANPTGYTLRLSFASEMKFSAKLYNIDVNGEMLAIDYHKNTIVVNVPPYSGVVLVQK